jgi:transcriptional regulator with XRE-family HTH domain
MKNLLVDRVETPNRRLWALRESMHINEADFAKNFDMTFEAYHLYEQTDSSVPEEFLQDVAARFSIPVAWLLCKCPILPIPKPRKEKQK